MYALSYFCVKILQLLLLVGQLKGLDHILRVDHMHYLAWVPNELTRGWYLGAPNPPNMSLFDVRAMCMTETHSRPGNLGRLERHDLGCTLAVHRWIGIFYVVYFIWSLLLLLLTAVDTVVVMSKVAIRPLRVRYTKKLLAGEGYEGVPSCLVRDFVEKGLGWGETD
jgi:Innexin